MNLPNPVKTPSFLQQIQWITDPVGYMESAAQRYPDIFSTAVAPVEDALVFVNHPQAIQEILTSDRKKFAALSRENKILQPLIGDSSVIMLDGDRHRRQRQLLMPPFHGERMRAYSEIIRNITEKVFSQLPHNKPLSIRTAMQEISLQVILQAVFGLYEGERCQQLKHLFSEMLEVFQSPLSFSFLFFRFLQKDLGAWSPWGRFLHKRQQIDKLLYAEIAERRAQDDPNRIDILSLLMSARDEKGKPLTDKELRDELMTLLFAGHETTATAMAWALYWIHHLPQVGEKLLQELGTLGDSPNPIDIARLPYLSAVCNETLRIYPVGFLTFGRVAQEPVEILGHHLESGKVVFGCIYLLHHREDLYPQPKQFKPERFLQRQYSPYEFMPFGGGARRCIGEALAVFEMKLVLATIVSRYHLALTTNQPEQAQRRGVTLAPSGKVKMMITGERKFQESPKAVASV
ncbi:cytochrome P450 [Brasilonema octagenarum UFV-E1]|uniref:Cytochrome P450 n=2 Tax=Brasilonema TaxID=383614 RepID=A0A856MFT6_9CYAN|nr:MULTISPECIES: cytochrome P450 [Brasilonema]NMF66261.1 cytochrome P450 [Brasilonema octagenarum UFV-OR1]QDL07947.1 cytochrome P450 [Brasilonema sennae CENA114]QDL14307.1 cytochrome P450 [Brasilonema octagenarum UFV-E1]